MIFKKKRAVYLIVTVCIKPFKKYSKCNCKVIDFLSDIIISDHNYIIITMLMSYHAEF